MPKNCEIRKEGKRSFIMIVIQYHVRKYHLLTFSRYEILGQKQIEVSSIISVCILHFQTQLSLERSSIEKRNRDE